MRVALWEPRMPEPPSGVRQPSATAGATPPTTNEVAVLGTGCPACDVLHEQTAEALRLAGASRVRLRRVTDADEIAAFGPVPTPALAVGGKVVLSGCAPNARALRRLLAPHLRSLRRREGAMRARRGD